jgi:hypothetical protein
MILDTLAAMADYNDNNTNWKRNRFDASATLGDDMNLLGEQVLNGNMAIPVETITFKGVSRPNLTPYQIAFQMDGLLKRTPRSVVENNLNEVL